MLKQQFIIVDNVAAVTSSLNRSTNFEFSIYDGSVSLFLFICECTCAYTNYVGCGLYRIFAEFIFFNFFATYASYLLSIQN